MDISALGLQAGNDVALVARGAHLQAIQANGLFVKSSTGDFHIAPFIATNSPAEVGVVDLVILGIKAWDVSEASEQIRPMIGPDTEFSRCKTVWRLRQKLLMF